MGEAQNQTQNTSVLEFSNAHGGLGPEDRKTNISQSALKEERIYQERSANLFRKE